MVSAIVALLMVGSLHVRVNLFCYSILTLLISVATVFSAVERHESSMYFLACAIAVLKGVSIPVFLYWIIDKLNLGSDSGAVVSAPLAMHLNIGLTAIAYFLVAELPVPHGEVRTWVGAMAAISMVLTGIVLMLIRRLAISQIIGFLVLENGIYIFALTQTHGMPLIIEMGVVLDVLVGVMIAGLLMFKIQSSFEHMDVSKLTDLRD
jgi:hydrogenase-4 component E